MMLVCAEWGAPYSHAVLFAGWADSGQDAVLGDRGVVVEGRHAPTLTPYPYWGSAAKYYRPYRYAGSRRTSLM